MKQVVFLVMALALLGLSSEASSLVRPQARRSNGDPDEFQARQVLDEGIVVRGSSLDAGGRSGEGRPPQAHGARPANRTEVTGRDLSPRISITFSGRTIFLER